MFLYKPVFYNNRVKNYLFYPDFKNNVKKLMKRILAFSFSTFFLGKSGILSIKKLLPIFTILSLGAYKTKSETRNRAPPAVLGEWHEECGRFHKAGYFGTKGAEIPGQNIFEHASFSRYFNSSSSRIGPSKGAPAGIFWLGSFRKAEKVLLFQKKLVWNLEIRVTNA